MKGPKKYSNIFNSYSFYCSKSIQLIILPFCCLLVVAALSDVVLGTSESEKETISNELNIFTHKLGVHADELHREGGGDEFYLDTLDSKGHITGIIGIICWFTVNLSGIKPVREVRDWYFYAIKLEESVKFLRFRVKQLEDNLTAVQSQLDSQVNVKDTSDST